MMTPAYDYKAQRWVEEPAAARRLHIEHLEEEITLLSSSKAQHYLSSMGYSETPAEALAMARAKIAEYREAGVDKHIEVYQYSPSTWWVSYREYIGGKLWQHDTTMNLTESEAMASARRRAAITGLDILIVQELAQTRQDEIPGRRPCRLSQLSTP